MDAAAGRRGECGAGSRGCCGEERAPRRRPRRRAPSPGRVTGIRAGAPESVARRAAGGGGRTLYDWSVIRINRAVERAKRRRGLWIVLLILLAILLALVALHSFGDGIANEDVAFCGVIVLLVAVVVIRPLDPIRVVVPTRVGRGPPGPVVDRIAERRLLVANVIPLRL